MNLFDCCVPYTLLPGSVLELPTKIALIAAIDIYRSGCAAYLEKTAKLSPYERRCRIEVTSELVRRGVLAETEERLELLPLDVDDRPLARREARRHPGERGLPQAQYVQHPCLVGVLLARPIQPDAVSN